MKITEEEIGQKQLGRDFFILLAKVTEFAFLINVKEGMELREN